MKTVKGPSDIPEGHHYAILTFKTESVFIPGDERSRTNPGHGYPERTEHYNSFEYEYTLNREEWVAKIETLESQKRLIAERGFGKATPYAAIEVASKAIIETKVVVGVKTK